MFCFCVHSGWFGEFEMEEKVITPVQPNFAYYLLQLHLMFVLVLFHKVHTLINQWLRAKSAKLAMLSGCERWHYSLSPVNQSDINQSQVSLSSSMQNREDSWLPPVCYAALRRCMSSSLKDCPHVLCDGERKPLSENVQDQLEEKIRENSKTKRKEIKVAMRIYWAQRTIVGNWNLQVGTKCKLPCAGYP